MGILLSRFPGTLPRLYLGLNHAILLVLLAVILCSALFFYALHVVPPISDQDLETQGTAYGLIHHLKPSLVTDRGTPYFFAHPLLLHFYIGNCFLLLDELDEVSYYYDTWLQGQKHNTGAVTEPEFFVQLSERDSERFESAPHLLATRMSNVFLSLFCFFFLFFFLQSLTGSFILSLAGPVVYFTFPEVAVRSSYGGYMAIENFSVLVIGYLYFFRNELKFKRKQRNWIFLLAGAFGAFSGQKIAIMVVAMAICDLVGSEGNLWARVKTALGNRIMQGAFLGTMLYVIYGSLIDFNVFVFEYFKEHFVERFLFNDVRLSSIAWYPSIVELWEEFASHQGYPFMFLAVLCSLYALSRIKKRESFFGFWFILGAVVFSVTDWRQTKHLMLIIPPLLIATILYVARSRTWVKVVFSLMLLLLVYHNIAVIVSLAGDFSIISPKPDW